MTRNFHRSDDKHKEIDKQTSIGRAVVVLGVAVVVAEEEAVAMIMVAEVLVCLKMFLMVY